MQVLRDLFVAEEVAKLKEIQIVINKSEIAFLTYIIINSNKQD